MSLLPRRKMIARSAQLVAGIGLGGTAAAADAIPPVPTAPALPGAARARIEAAIRHWETTREAEASAARLLNEAVWEGIGSEEELFAWHISHRRELANATEAAVGAMRQAGIRVLPIGEFVYIDASDEPEPEPEPDDHANPWRVLVIPRGKVDGLA